MSQVKPKAIYVGDYRVGEALASLRPEWDFLPFVKDITTLWDGLDSGEIDNNIQILLILDQFFDVKGEDDSLEMLVSSMLPYCFLGVVNYREALKDQMRERIQYKVDSSGGSAYEFFFINAKKPNLSLDLSIKKFIAESPLRDVAGIIAGKNFTENIVEAVDARVAEEPESTISQAVSQNSFYEEGPSDYLGQVVAITSSKGGSGKSTVAVSLATYLAHSSINSVREGLEEKPLKIIILDLDVRDGQLGFLTGNSKPTVINLRINGVSPEVIEQTVIHSSRLKVDLLLAPKRPRNSDDTPPDFYVELIHTLRKMYDYIILDTSVNYLDPLLEKVAYPTSDQIVFVTDIVVNSVFSMTRWIQEVTGPREKNGMGISKSKIGIVVNKSLSNVNMPGEKIARSALNIPVISAIPSNPKLVAHAANMQSMEVLLKHKDLYPAIRRLARSIAGAKYKLSDSVTP
jgi:MinD-like ATPase involved in chromosome partitioning or flagellar assembly